MEWILVLVLLVPGGGQPVASTVPGFKTREACLATIANARKEAEEQFSLSPEKSREMFRSSFCVPRGR